LDERKRSSWRTLRGEMKKNRPWRLLVVRRAGDGIRTHDNDVGNVVLYQLSYTRTAANHGLDPLASTVSPAKPGMQGL
jgi:hypothetical protein